MSQWYELDAINHERIKFAIVLAKFNDQFIIINNRKRGGWEIPGGNREPDETVLYTASRELFEETGSIRFNITPFGIYEWNGSFGMVFYADVEEMTSLPEYEITEIRFEDELPLGMNFGDMFYIFNDKWNQNKGIKFTEYKIDVRNLDNAKNKTIQPFSVEVGDCY